LRKGTISVVWGVAGEATRVRAEAVLSPKRVIRLAFDNVNDRTRPARLAAFRAAMVVGSSL